jgi:hypothetical protein
MLDDDRPDPLEQTWRRRLAREEPTRDLRARGPAPLVEVSCTVSAFLVCVGFAVAVFVLEWADEADGCPDDRDTYE